MIVFGTRASELALAQTTFVAERVRAATGEPYRIERIETAGDRITERPLAAIGVKGAFTAELEEALRARRIDAAVHSLKDLPVDEPADLTIAAVPERRDPHDVVVAQPGAIDDAAPGLPLRPGARLGTSSPRRRFSALAARPDLALGDIRGNVPTRVAKVARGDYDAVLLAAAGLDRLELDLRGLVRRSLPTTAFPPAPGQGALAVECRTAAAATRALLRRVHDAVAARCVAAERELLQALGGGCSLPLGALAAPAAHGFLLQAALYGDGGEALRAETHCADPAAATRALATAWRPLLGRPLLGMRIAMPRPDGRPGALAAALRFAGAAVEVPAWTRSEPIEPPAHELAQALRAPAMAFTSVRSVERLLAVAHTQAAALRTARVFAVGASTAAALRAAGCEPIVADGTGGEALATVALLTLGRGQSIAFPCALERHDGFERAAAAVGLAVRPLPLYRTLPVGSAVAPASRPDVVLFTAPSAVAAFAAQPALRDVSCAAIGALTAAALRAHGCRVAAVAAQAEPAAIVLALQEVPRARSA